MSYRYGMLPFIILLSSCGSSSEENEAPSHIALPIAPGVVLSYSFSNSVEGFEINVADYYVDHPDNKKIAAGLALLPEPYEYRQGIRFSWFNYSADIKGFIKKKITQLEADTTYSVSFRVEIITSESNECAGVGGGPGSSVYVKGAVLSFEPTRFVSSESGVNAMYRVNIDDGQSGGEDVALLGNIGLPISCEASQESQTWELKTLANDEGYTVTTSSSGDAWVYVSIDSGFEGTTEVFIADVELEITQQ